MGTLDVVWNLYENIDRLMSSSANDLSNNYLENGSMPVKWEINENGDKYKLFVNMIRAHCS